MSEIDSNSNDTFNSRIFDELRAKARRMLAKEERDARKQRSAVSFCLNFLNKVFF